MGEVQNPTLHVSEAGLTAVRYIANNDGTTQNACGKRNQCDAGMATSFRERIANNLAAVPLCDSQCGSGKRRSIERKFRSVFAV